MFNYMNNKYASFGSPSMLGWACGYNETSETHPFERKNIYILRSTYIQTYICNLAQTEKNNVFNQYL